mgnify:CR=1 FL=1
MYKPAGATDWMHASEVYNAVKRKNNSFPGTQHPHGELSFSRFVSRNGLNPDLCKTPWEFHNNLSYDEKVKLFKRMGFELLKYTVSKKNMTEFLQNYSVDMKKSYPVVFEARLDANQSVFFLLRK